jgi:hypothetical protein
MQVAEYHDTRTHRRVWIPYENAEMYKKRVTTFFETAWGFTIPTDSGLEWKLVGIS